MEPLFSTMESRNTFEGKSGDVPGSKKHVAVSRRRHRLRRSITGSGLIAGHGALQPVVEKADL